MGRTTPHPWVPWKSGEEHGAPPATPKVEKAASPQGHRTVLLNGQLRSGPPRPGDQGGLLETPEGSSIEQDRD